jgi:hypothetical protein
MELKPKKHAGANRKIVDRRRDAAAAEPNWLQPKDSWDQQQAADQADEARLKRKLIICRTCGGESEGSNTTFSH